MFLRRQFETWVSVMADIHIYQTRCLNRCPIQQADVQKNGRTTMRHSIRYGKPWSVGSQLQLGFCVKKCMTLNASVCSCPLSHFFVVGATFWVCPPRLPQWYEQYRRAQWLTWPPFPPGTLHQNVDMFYQTSPRIRMSMPTWLCFQMWTCMFPATSHLIRSIARVNCQTYWRPTKQYTFFENNP